MRTGDVVRRVTVAFDVELTVRGVEVPDDPPEDLATAPPPLVPPDDGYFARLARLLLESPAAPVWLRERALFAVATWGEEFNSGAGDLIDHPRCLLPPDLRMDREDAELARAIAAMPWQLRHWLGDPPHDGGLQVTFDLLHHRVETIRVSEPEAVQ